MERNEKPTQTVSPSSEERLSTPAEEKDSESQPESNSPTAGRVDDDLDLFNLPVENLADKTPDEIRASSLYQHLKKKLMPVVKRIRKKTEDLTKEWKSLAHLIHRVMTDENKNKHGSKVALQLARDCAIPKQYIYAAKNWIDIDPDEPGIIRTHWPYLPWDRIRSLTYGIKTPEELKSLRDYCQEKELDLASLSGEAFKKALSDWKTWSEHTGSDGSLDEEEEEEEAGGDGDGDGDEGAGGDDDGDGGEGAGGDGDGAEGDGEGEESIDLATAKEYVKDHDRYPDWFTLRLFRLRQRNPILADMVFPNGNEHGWGFSVDGLNWDCDEEFDELLRGLRRGAPREDGNS